MKTCPNHCAIPHRPQADFCLGCGVRLTATASASVQARQRTAALWQKQVDELNASTGADKHLQFIKGVLERAEIAAEVRDEIFKQVERIERRLNDPNLYLAVVGEFSSGKTTFINALLRDDLLKTESLVTTAAATKLKSGEFVSVDVHFQDYPNSYVQASEETGQITVIDKSPQDQTVWDSVSSAMKRSWEWMQATSDTQEKSAWGSVIGAAKWSWRQIQSSAVKPPPLIDLLLTWFTTLDDIDVKQFIHTVSAENQMAQKVTDVIITHPAAFLADGIVIIDTPGTNANTANAANLHHRATTQRVVEKDADAAIIMVPANQPLSQTLRDFLAEHLQPYLHRCIFVVTRMDDIRRTREQQRLLEFVRQGLINEFGVSSPMVYASGAQIVIDDLTGSEEVRQRLLVWKERFVELENVILNRLRQERVLSIAENILRLLTQLFQQLDGHLQTQWQQYQAHQAAITREVIPNLSSFAKKQRRLCRSQVEEVIPIVRAKMDGYVQQHRVEVLSAIESVIFKADNAAALKAIVGNIDTTLQKTNAILQEAISSYLTLISQAGEKAGRDFDQKFADAYRRLSVLGGRVNVGTYSASQIRVNTSYRFSSVQSLNNEIAQQDFIAGAGGAGAGAMIGTFILPGVGTFIGGAVGALFGGLFSDSLYERKTKIWDELHPSLIKYLNAVEQQALSTVNDHAANVQNALDHRINSYISQYQAVVDRMQAEQAAEHKRLTQLQQSTQADLRQLKRRQKSVSAQKKRLAQMSINS